MDIKDFLGQMKSHRSQIDTLMRRRLPVIVGRMAKDHYQENFRLSAFVDGGQHPWPVTKRQQSGGKSAADNYAPLLSRRNHLFSSVKYTPGDYRVTVANDVLYAPVHNWGGTTHPTVTDKMRRYAWRQFYKEAGIRKGASAKTKKKRTEAAAVNPRAQRWKALALTKKTKLTVNIPQRQFIGESRELDGKIIARARKEIMDILYK